MRLASLLLAAIAACGSEKSNAGIGGGEADALCRSSCDITTGCNSDGYLGCYDDCRAELAARCGKHSAAWHQCMLDVRCANWDACREFLDAYEACWWELNDACQPVDWGGACEPGSGVYGYCNLSSDTAQCGNYVTGCRLSGGDCNTEAIRAECEHQERAGVLTCSVGECIECSEEDTCSGSNCPSK